MDPDAGSCVGRSVHSRTMSDPHAVRGAEGSDPGGGGGTGTAFFAASIEALRRRLLDLTGRNPLLNYRHGRTKRSIRVIDEHPDQMFARLQGESVLRFKSIGEPDDEPEDEKTPEFRRALDAARLDDEAYVKALSAAAASDSNEKALAKLERDLRGRVRERLGMVARKDAPLTTPADAAARLGLDPSFDLPLDGGERAPDPAATPARHADNVVQTLLYEEDMERALSSIREHTRLSISESGVNPLFCVFGFLEWYEDASSQTPMHAPLMLYPLEIDYDIVRGKRKHLVVGAGDGALENVALAERLKRDFGLELPRITEEDTPESYMRRVAEMAAAMKGWRVRRWSTFGLFSFARIAMYHDLDRTRWTGAATMEQNPILTRLIAGGGAVETTAGAEIEPAPVDEIELPLIADADSSQADAVRAAIDGRSMVIEGPPGTGKSQTITNIIAASLANGKRVLFVAEKMAALSVVKKRLDDAGLGPFCLELHSTKVGRREAFGAFAQRLSATIAPHADRDLRTTLENLGVEKRELEACVEALGSPAGELGCTVQQLLWRCGAARERTTWLRPEIDDIVLDGAERLTEPDAGRVIAAAAAAERAWTALEREFGAPEKCPWHGVASPRLDAIGAGDAARRMAAFAPMARGLAAIADEVERECAWRAPSVTELEGLTRILDAAQPPLGMDRAVMAAGDEGIRAWLDKACGAIGGITRDQAMTIEGERMIVDAVERAREASASLLAARSEPLVSAGAAEALAKLDHAAQRLREERARLGAAMRLDGLEAAEARTHARALRGAPALPWLSPAWWRARGFVKGIAKEGAARKWSEWASPLEDAAAHIEAWRSAEQDPEARRLLGVAHKGAMSDLDAARSVASWATSVRAIGRDGASLLVVDFLLRASPERIGALAALGDAEEFSRLLAGVTYIRSLGASGVPAPVRAWINQTSAATRDTWLRAVARRIADAVAPWRSSLAQLEAVAPVDAETWAGTERIESASPGAVADRAERCAADPESLQRMCDALRCRADAEGEGLARVIAIVAGTRPGLEGLADAAKRVVLQSLVRHVIARSPALQRFSGEHHESHRARFRELDRRLLALRQRHIAAAIAKRPVDPGSDAGPKKQWTGRALVEHVAATPRTPTHLRDVFDRAAGAVQQLMPCFMMSPLSVAQFLKPGAIAFDLVIMDEASQMRPEDAIGAIARGTQVVIVGDPKQLPPTAFFMGSDATPDEEGEGSAADEQSILDQGMATLRPIRRLKWHYRSRHASLIAYSNSEFYDGELVVFPSPHHEHADFGVRYVRVENGVYGGRGLNPIEARRIAEEAVAYALRHPERSLGLVALNQPQTERIILEVDRLASEHPAFEAWRKHRDGTLEPFFVKNLENVQGDERDAIFISTVYGRDANGAFPQRFGPINNQGGHRRLNVLYTRAKCQTIVFTSMDPGEIRAEEGSSWGARALKGYLAFAKSGVIGHGMGTNATETARAPDSPFEIEVLRVLREAGFDAAPQVGVGGYFIDVAVRHPERAGEFVLGIECDGAAYHSSRSARDRDRLRQEVLERLGWRIHRIWSLDWFKSPQRERERLIRAVREAITHP